MLDKCDKCDPAPSMDTFAKDRLPPRDEWPRLHFDLPELAYPDRLNCATVLLDDAVAEGHGDRPAILTEAGTITYRELLKWANRIANVLAQAGVAPGNRVLLRGFNGPELYAAWLAVMKTGAIAVTTMPMLRAPELTAIIGKAKPAFALCDQRLVGELSAVASDGGVRTLITWGDGDLEGRMAAAPDSFTNADTAADDVCLLAFTSGTTGQPKACAHFHRDVLAMADVVARHLVQAYRGDVYGGDRADRGAGAGDGARRHRAPSRHLLLHCAVRLPRARRRACGQRLALVEALRFGGGVPPEIGVRRLV